MRLPLLLAALLATPVLIMPVLAQTPLTGTTPPTTNAPPLAGTSAQPGTPPAAAPATDLPSTPARARHGRRTRAERFNQANTTHDGKLTLEQARAAHMNAVVRDFSAIDKNGKGYVTLAEIREHGREVRAAHRSRPQPPA